MSDDENKTARLVGGGLEPAPATVPAATADDEKNDDNYEKRRCVHVALLGSRVAREIESLPHPLSISLTSLRETASNSLKDARSAVTGAAVAPNQSDCPISGSNDVGHRGALPNGNGPAASCRP